VSSLSRLVRLAILDSYGVEWSLATFARDVLQNFFDAAASFREIVLDRDDAAGTLEVRGPAEFDLELLAYVGATTKRDGKTAGGFGEGFKICALVGVRDHGLAIRAGSGETELEVAFEPVPLGRELCYRVRNAPGRKGSFVRLEGCTEAVFTAFETARHQFYHEDNPHLGPLVATDAARTVAVHLAAPGEKCGEIYYRRQFRGEIAYHGDRAGPAPRLTLACHHAVESLEGDRDRRILEPERVARAVGDRLPPEGLHQALLLLEGEWPHRHEVTDGLLRAAIDRKLRFDWPDGWLARSPRNDHGLGRLAEREGFKLAVAEFGAIGMRTPKDAIRVEKGKDRTPTPAERERIDVAVALYGALSGDDPPAAVEWKIFDATKGQAPHGHHDGRKLFVPAQSLGADGFAQGASVVLHELAHELGEEDSPAFLNRLARLVGAAIRDPSAVAAARARFERDRPKGRRVPEVPSVDPYKPAFEVRPTDSRRGTYFVNLYVPPGFPPTTALLDRIYEGAAAAGLPCYPMLTEVWSSADARRLELRGIPIVKFGSIEVDASGASGRPGLRLRTYGPERGVLPSVEMVAGALHAYVAGLLAGTPKVQPPEQQLASRDSMARYRCFEWAKATARGTGREQLEIGLASACAIRLDAVKKGVEQTYEELSAAVQDDVLPMKQAADAHVAAQTDFDPGDGFEEDALRVAHTVFLAGFAAGGAERAARDFAVVREATKELLAADLGSYMREAVLAWAVDRTGPKENYVITPRLEPLDEAAFRAAFAKGLGEARRIQLMLDHEERGLRWGELERRLDSAILTPDEREEARLKKLASVAATGRWARHQRMRAVLTHTIKETWERTLAETGSGATAGEACIALLRRLENEVAADERRAAKGAA
jgi:hypothetical protein